MIANPTWPTVRRDPDWVEPLPPRWLVVSPEPIPFLTAGFYCPLGHAFAGNYAYPFSQWERALQAAMQASHVERRESGIRRLFSLAGAR